MPALPWIQAALPAVMQGIGTLFGAASTKQQNERSEAFSREMYERQRKDAHSDWLMQNEYNSPKEMMKRFRDAGLNENLVYGQAGQSAATAVRSTDAGTPSFTPFTPELGGIGNSLSAFMDFRLKDAQADNLAAQNAVIVQDALLRAAQVSKTTYQAEKEGTTLRMSAGADPGNLYESIQLQSLEAMKALLEKNLASTKFTLNENERRALTTASSLSQAAERILNMRMDRDRAAQAIRNMKKDESLKELDIELRRNGLTPSSPVYLQILSRFLEKFGLSMDSVK